MLMDYIILNNFLMKKILSDNGFPKAKYLARYMDTSIERAFYSAISFLDKINRKIIKSAGINNPDISIFNYKY